MRNSGPDQRYVLNCEKMLLGNIGLPHLCGSLLHKESIPFIFYPCLHHRFRYDEIGETNTLMLTSVSI